MPGPLEMFVSFGFALFGHAWSALTVFCLLGLGYLLGGHRLRLPMRNAINRTIVVVMAAVILFAVLYVPAAIYAAGYDRHYGYAVYAFLITMSAPCLLSMIGLALVRWSRYPRAR